VLAVAGVTVAARPVSDGVCDGGYQSGGSRAELGGQRGDGFGLAAAGCQFAGVIFGGVVQQGGADDVGVGDAVVADNPDGDAE